MSNKDLSVYVNTSIDEIKATAGNMPKRWFFNIMVGNIKISNPRIGKPGVIHITTGRADSLEGGDFKVSELEMAIQDFFDKNF
jgi:hypothetical protein